jgi:hypothetical protein
LGAYCLYGLFKGQNRSFSLQEGLKSLYSRPIPESRS